jgi:hypothetical protein
MIKYVVYFLVCIQYVYSPLFYLGIREILGLTSSGLNQLILCEHCKFKELNQSEKNQAIVFTDLSSCFNCSNHRSYEKEGDMILEEKRRQFFILQ